MSLFACEIASCQSSRIANSVQAVQVDSSVFRKVDSLANLEMAKDNIGCMNIGIVLKGSLIWTNSYGFADSKRNNKANINLIFPMASITKQFTSLMLMQLVEKGKVSLSDPVEKYFPEIKSLKTKFTGRSPITFLQLATHTSGLDREPDDEQLLYVKGPVEEWEKKLIATIPLTEIIYEPGTRYFYSNIGYAILGAALSRVAGEPYIAYIQNHILNPLGMKDTYFVLDKEKTYRRPVGYLIENGKIDSLEPMQQEIEGRGWRVPSARLYSTIPDLALFVNFELGRDSSILSKKFFDANYKRLYSASSDLSYAYGIGLQVRRRGTVITYGHDGVLAGYYSSIWVDPITQIGIITLTTKPEKYFGLRALEILVTEIKNLNN
ncbi:MAG: beta-lactamase family protein [Chitinophagaceae bacterium]|nr:beta-lactamase family protein [Chitinophagaceae bacterium]